MTLDCQPYEALKKTLYINKLLKSALQLLFKVNRALTSFINLSFFMH